jgi:hypothetical protein
MPASPPLSIGRCPARSRSFLLEGPDGTPAGDPPGECLHSGVGMAANKKRDRQDQPIRVSTLSGEPRGTGPPSGRRRLQDDGIPSGFEPLASGIPLHCPWW